MSTIINGSTGITFPDSSVQAAAASPYVLKNRIINGAMVIDQRNAGASITNTGSTSAGFAVDRFTTVGTQNTKLTMQQNAGSVTPPTGFTKYLGITTTSAYTITSSDWFITQQRIEGVNTADLAWGTVNAQTVTLSFWVRSSLTGTFGGSLKNADSTRSYPFSYTISSANTWEYKTVTIAGDTTGTWVTTTADYGIAITFSLGAGSAFSGTSGSWASANYYAPTGATSVVGTNGATFYITGVQLEVGSTATPFERRLYGQELANCQRYYYKTIPSTSNPLTDGAWAFQATGAYGITKFPVTLRANPSALEQSGTAADYAVYIGGAATNCSAIPTYVFSSVDRAMTTFTVASGLTTGQGGYARPTGANAYLAWSAEL